MRRIFIGLSLLVLLPVCLAIALSATGTINSSSLHMILNNMAGLSGPPANENVVRQSYKVPEGFMPGWDFRAERHVPYAGQ